MRLRASAPAVLPLLALVVGFGGAAVVLRDRAITVTFQRAGRVFRIEDGRRRPMPATLLLRDAESVRLRVVNRDARFHAIGVLSVAPGDSVEVRPDACATTWSGPDLVVLVR